MEVTDFVDVLIYAKPGFSLPRDQLEDLIEAFLGGKGEVTGGGAGRDGANIDVEVFDGRGLSAEVVAEGLRRILKQSGATGEVHMVIDGVRHEVTGAA